MRILVVHNAYQQPGGEDAVVQAETRLLEQNGAQVIRYQRSNDELRKNSSLASLGVAISATWSVSSYDALYKIVKNEKPDVAHFHNTFPLISPSAYYACADLDVPVVQTLHNYRLVCPAGSLLRDGQVCEACLSKRIPWPGVLHACYRASRAVTAATAAMLAIHRTLDTWRDKVDVYIALSEFARNKFIEGGLPAERVMVKPNFAFRPPVAQSRHGGFALFVGRLSPEKGPQLLPTAWKLLPAGIPLRIAGDGPLFEPLHTTLANSNQKAIELLGHCCSERIATLMSGSRFQVVPSIWYEGFPMVVVEAFSYGLPVIASRLGSLAELIKDGVTGLHFESGNAADLATKVAWAWAHPEEMARMGRNARAEFELKYEASTNFKMLMEIYQRASVISSAGSGAQVVSQTVRQN